MPHLFDLWSESRKKRLYFDSSFIHCIPYFYTVNFSRYLIVGHFAGFRFIGRNILNIKEYFIIYFNKFVEEYCFSSLHREFHGENLKIDGDIVLDSLNMVFRDEDTIYNKYMESKYVRISIIMIYIFVYNC